MIYDSSLPLSRDTAKTFLEVESNKLTSNSSALKLSDSIKKRFNKFIIKTREDVICLNDFIGLSDGSISLSYDRNGTEHIAILNPVYIIDKLPNFK